MSVWNPIQGQCGMAHDAILIGYQVFATALRIWDDHHRRCEGNTDLGRCQLCVLLYSFIKITLLRSWVNIQNNFYARILKTMMMLSTFFSRIVRANGRWRDNPVSLCEDWIYSTPHSEANRLTSANADSFSIPTPRIFKFFSAKRHVRVPTSAFVEVLPNKIIMPHRALAYRRMNFS